MTSLKYLTLAVPFLLVALVPIALAADDKKDDKKADDKAEKMDESEYYPLKVNSVWHYKIGDNKFRLKAEKMETYEGKPSMRVVMLSEGSDKAQSFENIQVTKDGVYRLGFEGNKADPPVKFLALPPKDGDKWMFDSKIGKETLKGTFKIGEEKKVKVPAGEYDTYYTDCEDLDANGTKASFKMYFAKGVGMVKQVITIGKQEVVIELEKYEEGK